MRGSGEFSGEILASIVKHLVSSTLPEEASRYIVDLAVIGDVRRPTGFGHHTSRVLPP